MLSDYIFISIFLHSYIVRVLKIWSGLVNNRDSLTAPFSFTMFFPAQSLVFSLIIGICLEGNAHISSISHLFSLVFIICILRGRIIVLVEFKTGIGVVFCVLYLLSYIWREEGIV